MNQKNVYIGGYCMACSDVNKLIDFEGVYNNYWLIMINSMKTNYSLHNSKGLKFMGLG